MSVETKENRQVDKFDLRNEIFSLINNQPGEPRKDLDSIRNEIPVLFKEAELVSASDNYITVEFPHKAFRITVEEVEKE